MSTVRVHDDLPANVTPYRKVRPENFAYYEVPEEAYNLIRKRAKSELYDEIINEFKTRSLGPWSETAVEFIEFLKHRPERIV